MKRTFTVVLMVSLLTFHCCAFAEEGSNSAVPSPMDSIKFMDIDWLSTEAFVKEKVDSVDGIEKAWFPEEENARIEGWDKEYVLMYSEPNIEKGGVILKYSNLPIFGYDAGLELSFMYSVKDEKVSRIKEDSLFYMAEYTLKGIKDTEAVFEEITSELSSLYGEPTYNSHYNSFTQAYSPIENIWNASDGSLVCLAEYYDVFTDKYNECTITYAAPDTVGLLNELAEEIQSDVYEDEAAVREQNQLNTEGL